MKVNVKGPYDMGPWWLCYLVKNFDDKGLVPWNLEGTLDALRSSLVGLPENYPQNK